MLFRSLIMNFRRKSSGTKEGTERRKRKYVYSCTDSDTDADTYSDSHSDTESDTYSDLGTDSHSETDPEDVLADKGRMQDGKVPYRKGKTAKLVPAVSFLIYMFSSLLVSS